MSDHDEAIADRDVCDEEMTDDEVRAALKSLMGALEQEIAADTERSRSAAERKPRSWIDALGTKR